MRGVLIAGFPYIRERYFATWRHYLRPEDLHFLLPKRWTAKSGKVVFTPPDDERVSTATTLFPHSHFPVIGGLLKGWMPAFPLHLWHMRRSVSLVYACSEPTLLSTLYFSLFTKLLRKKLVLFTWENIPYEQKLRGLSRFIHLAILHLNLLLSDGLICGNPEGELIHRQYTGKPITVIPMNGLDPKFFSRSAVRANYQLPISDIPRDSVVFTYIGAIGYRKGIHLAVRALPEVLKKVPNAYLVIAGSGEYEKGLDAEIAHSGAHERIIRIPWLDGEGVRALLAASDVFLYPSIPYGGWAEQFGYSMAEASLMEVPVIATHSGSIPYVVRHERTGLLVSPDDVGALGDAMARLGADDDLRQRLGKQGRQSVSERFSHRAVGKQFYEFFNRVNRKSPSA